MWGGQEKPIYRLERVGGVFEGGAWYPNAHYKSSLNKNQKHL